MGITEAVMYADGIGKPKRQRRIVLHGVVSRKALVHGIAQCQDCDWEEQDYLTVQKKARLHAQQTGHKISMDLGYAVTIAANKKLCRADEDSGGAQPKETNE